MGRETVEASAPDVAATQPTLSGLKPVITPSPEDFLEAGVPYQLSEIARQVCAAGIENPGLAVASLQQVRKILKAAVGPEEKDVLTLLALRLAGAPETDGSSDLAARALTDVEILLWMQREFAQFEPTLPIPVVVAALHGVAADLLVGEKPVRKPARQTRLQVLPEGRTTLRIIAAECGVPLEALRDAVRQAALNNEDFGREGKGSKTTYDELRLRAVAKDLEPQKPGVKKN